LVLGLAVSFLLVDNKFVHARDNIKRHSSFHSFFVQGFQYSAFYSGFLGMTGSALQRKNLHSFSSPYSQQSTGITFFRKIRLNRSP
jgi:hypothetical protein